MNAFDLKKNKGGPRNVHVSCLTENAMTFEAHTSNEICNFW